MVWSNVTEQQQPSRCSSMCSNLALIHKQGTIRPLLFFFPSLKENPATIAGPSPDKTAKKINKLFLVLQHKSAIQSQSLMHTKSSHSDIFHQSG